MRRKVFIRHQQATTLSWPCAARTIGACAAAALALFAFLCAGVVLPAEPLTITQKPPVLQRQQSSASLGGAIMEVPRSQTTTPSTDILEIPQLTGPTMPPTPPALASVKIPAGLIGCWEGDPVDFDQVQTDSFIKSIGTPGKIVFCYRAESIDVRQVEIRVSPLARAYDIALSMGLSYTTFKAEGVRTDVFLVTPDTLRTRTMLDVVATAHVFWLIPLHQHQGMVEDEVVKLNGNDSVSVKARFLCTTPSIKMWGTWHADFHRVSDYTAPPNS